MPPRPVGPPPGFLDDPTPPARPRGSGPLVPALLALGVFVAMAVFAIQSCSEVDVPGPSPAGGGT